MLIVKQVARAQIDELEERETRETLGDHTGIDLISKRLSFFELLENVVSWCFLQPALGAHPLAPIASTNRLSIWEGAIHVKASTFFIAQ
jgi:hypothetical protein